MGCASSKHLGRRPLKENWSAPLPKSISMPVYHPPQEEGDSYHFVSLTSSSYGVLTLDNAQHNGTNNGSFLGFCRQKEEDECDKNDVESINTKELMEGLEVEAELSPSILANASFPAITESEKLGTSVSFHTVKEYDAHYAKVGSPVGSIWSKYQKSNGSSPVMRKFFGGSSKLSPINFNFKTNLSFRETAELSSVSSMEKSLSGSPFFDPSVMHIFEKALDYLPADDWHVVTSESTVSASSSVRNASSSSDNSFDADSPQLERTDYIWNTRENSLFDVGSGGKLEKSDGKKQSFSKILPVYYKYDWKVHEYLESFEVKCPPGGEGRVVLYCTSMRGIRKTYEDCSELKSILQGTGVHVDERDVWMHSKFKQELIDLFGMVTGLPRLFVKGRYVGGMEQVKKLHDAGILAKLLEGLPMNTSRKICDGCGDVRFVPCLTCSGSCKVISEDKLVSRCAVCNENGLIMCPLCS